jgi:hypothetical protein
MGRLTSRRCERDVREAAGGCQAGALMGKSRMVLSIFAGAIAKRRGLRVWALAKGDTVG